MSELHSVSGYLTDLGSGGFVLRTAKEPIKIFTKLSLPVMRPGDQITVVMHGSLDAKPDILVVANLSTGSENRYQPQPPFMDEAIRWTHLVWMAVVILMMNLGSFACGYLRLQPSTILEAMSFFSIFGYMIVLAVFYHRAVVSRHNIGLSNRAQELVTASLMDLSLWQAPSALEGSENETWKDC
jgi:hypothetical protein